MRYKDSIEQILSEPYDKNLVKPCVESKVFGIGVESYTVGSAEFTLSFAATHDGCMPLMDNGHYHPTEVGLRQDSGNALLLSGVRTSHHKTGTLGF